MCFNHINKNFIRFLKQFYKDTDIFINENLMRQLIEV